MILFNADEEKIFESAANMQYKKGTAGMLGYNKGGN